MSGEHCTVIELLFLQRGPPGSSTCLWQFLWKKWKMSLQRMVDCRLSLYLPTGGKDWPTQGVPYQWDFPPPLFSRCPHGVSVFLKKIGQGETEKALVWSSFPLYLRSCDHLKMEFQFRDASSTCDNSCEVVRCHFSISTTAPLQALPNLTMAWHWISHLLNAFFFKSANMLALLV